MQEIIQKAIDNNWNPFKAPIKKMEYSDGITTFYMDKIELINLKKEIKTISINLSLEFIILDPLFWQALGRAFNWKEYGSHETRGNNLRCFRCGEVWDSSTDCLENKFKTWLIKWHQCIDHLSEGNSIESYFIK